MSVDAVQITVRAGRDIAEGEHISTMYSHALWGTIARRDHLHITKNFWCTCPRCVDTTEFGSNFSTILDSGHPMLPADPLDSESDWVCEKTGMRKTADEVKLMLSKIGQELEEVTSKGSVDDAEDFLEKHSKTLHPNHYHLTTCKHNLLQMYGRTEGYLIQVFWICLLSCVWFDWLYWCRTWTRSSCGGRSRCAGSTSPSSSRSTRTTFGS